jgi:hypothetical protein
MVNLSEVIISLSNKFPKALFEDPTQIRPLKIGIDKDICALLPDFELSLIRKALMRYTHKPSYFKSFQKNVWRIDLNGNKVQHLLAEDYRYARVNLFTIKIRELIAKLNSLESQDSPQAANIIKLLNLKCTELMKERKTPQMWGKFGEVLYISRTLFEAYDAMVGVSPKYISQARQSSYYLYITEAIHSLTKGEFSVSKDYYRKALDVARKQGYTEKLPQPNYFLDLREIVSHSNYIDGIQSFKNEDFPAASNYFLRWITINQEKKGDLRFDCIYFYHLVCQLLNKLTKRHLSKTDWDEMDKYINTAYLSRSARVLVTRLDVIKALSVRKRYHEQKEMILCEISAISKEWKLLIPEVPIIGEDRCATLREKLQLPIFLNIYSYLSCDDDQWQDILIQNLRNALLIKADYEQRRAMYKKLRGKSEKSLPLKIENRPQSNVLEGLSNKVLVQIIEEHLQERHNTHLKILQSALPLLEAFRRAINSDDFQGAIDSQLEFFNITRMLPHIIYIVDETEYKEVSKDDRNSLSERTAKRLWTGLPDTINLERAQQLQYGSYYYMRPGWYRRQTKCFSNANEPYLKTTLPKWLNVFYKNIIGNGCVPSNRFMAWISQFPEDKRLIACRLIHGLRYYDDNKVRTQWATLYRKQLPPEAKTRNVAYCGIGHTGKSSSLTLYYLRQALENIPENECSFEFKYAFQSLNNYSNDEVEHPETVVFVDDIIGTGGQAIKELNRIFADPKNAWLENSKLYYCALIGFKDGINNIQTALGDKLQAIFVGETLYDEDKAFSVDNVLWESAQERQYAKKWVAEAGTEIIAEMYDDPSEHCLGWNKSQALIAFHYNTPNNTLPIFWGTGKFNGKDWFPLLMRIG